MQRSIALFILLSLASFALAAEKITDVSLRYGRQENMMRLVFEADDDLIKNANVSVSLSGIKIEFPSAFEVRKPRDFSYETAKRDHSYYIFLRDVIDIKTSRLTAPARLVFDLKLSGKTYSPPEAKTFQPTGPLVSPAPSKENAPRPAVPQPAQPEPKMPKPAGPLVSPAPGKENAPKPPNAQNKQAPQKPQQPAQAATPAEKPRKVKVVVLDPGHGGYDYGIVSQDAREKDVNLLLSRDMSSAMAKKGQTVFLTRKVDQSMPISERINFSNAKTPDLFISLHAAFGNVFAVYLAASEDLNIDAAVRLYSLSSRQGRHVARSREAAVAVAESIQKEFKTEVVLRELPLPVLNSLNAPAFLVEYPSVKSYATDQKMREKLVGSVLKGIAAYEQ